MSSTGETVKETRWDLHTKWRMMLNRDAGSGVLGDDGEVCVQSVGERAQIVDEYNNDSRNFANENKLENKSVTTLTSKRSEGLTRCHQTFYIVPSALYRPYSSATPLLPRNRYPMGFVPPPSQKQKSHHGSICVRAAFGEIYK
jgi:hypothetical protein